ncbi:MAG: PfkB family carbohydrate kinase [Chitinophagaceae bacterium]
MSDLDFDDLFQRFRQLKVGVVGDVMLDTYLWGSVERISPEAPVPIVTLSKKDFRLGGAANVCLNLKGLGARVQAFSVTGDDDDAIVLFSHFEKEGIGTGSIIKSKSRITTNKSRIISRNQQMLRLDSEITNDLSPEDENNLIGAIERFVNREKPAVMVLEDYNKGVLTARVIAETIRICKEQGVLTTVDPKKKNFLNYRGVSIFKPNLKEVREALHIEGKFSTDQLDRIHEMLHAEMQHEVSLITLSELGVFYCKNGKSTIIPSHFRNIADVSGAGDTVISVASLVYAASGDIDLAAQISNIAGGLVCEEVGTVAIDGERLLEECKLLLTN